MELRQRVVKGVAWQSVEKVVTALLQFAVSMVLMNHLTPTDYGSWAILSIFLAILLPVVDSGFSQALIRKKEIKDGDYSSVFYVNVLIAIVLYLILWAATPFLSRFFEDELFAQIAPVLFLLFPINSLSIIQSTILSRQLEYRRLSLYTLVASIVSSVAAILMALNGFGLWALVAQRMLALAVKALLMWIMSDWKPELKFSLESIKGMFRYGSRIMLSDLVSNIYYQISGLFIERGHGKAQLGFYDRGNKIKELPVSSSINAVMGVSFASLSRLQGDDEHFHDSARKIFLLWGFVMWPVMFGLICVVGDMFRFLLPEVWMPTVPYIQILSLAGLLAPLSVISYNIVKIKSDGNMIFRIEVVKKAIATIVLIITIPISVKAIAWGQVIIFVSDMLVNALTAHRYSPRWTLWARTKDLLPYIFATGVMVGVLAVITMLTASWAAGWVLLVKVLVGVVVYCSVNALFRFEAWQEMMTILKGYVKKN